MKRTHWLVAGAGALAIGMFSIGAQAAPLGNTAGGVKATGENALVQDVTWGRRCWWHRGHRHCRNVRRGHRHGSYYRGYGYGPGISLHFGQRHHHRHHRHHRRW